MTKTIMLFAIGLATVFAGCKKVKQLADINVDLPYSTQFTVPDVTGYPAGTVLPFGGVTLPFPAVPVPTYSKQFIATYHTAVNKIVDVDLKSLKLQILSPATQNFDFLDTVKLYISANSQPEVLVAYANGVPKGQTTLDMYTITAVNLKDYFVQDTMYFRLTAHINSVPASGTQLNLSSVFHVLANPLN